MEGYNELLDNFQVLSISTNKKKRVRRRKPKPKKRYFEINLDCTLMGIDVIYQTQLRTGDVFQTVNDVLMYKVINKTSHQFKKIKLHFAKNKLTVKSLKEVVNPYLKKSFEMKRTFFYNNIEPLQLFHGTKKENVDEICTYNFDWRLSGVAKGYKYGKGVNFAKKPFFAAFFGDKKKEATIIIADVLVRKIAKGNENLVVPPDGFDTTSGKCRTIFVKFNDHEFYPRYIVNFVRK